MSKLFPHILFRIAGNSLDVLAPLKISGYSAILPVLQEKEKEHNLLREGLSQAIFDAIHDAADVKYQNRLLELRRHIFNKRYHKIGKLLDTGSPVREDLERDILLYIRQAGQLSSLRQEWSETYTREVNRIRNDFRDIINDELFLKGLAFSSEVLLNNLEALHRKRPEEYGSRELDLELSLLKYITRMVAKTSPLSTFTSIVHGRIHKGSSSAIQPDPAIIQGEEEIRSFVRLNNYIFRSLKNIFENYREIYSTLSVRLNPTLRIVNGQLLFLRSLNNKETFQRLGRNDVLDLVTAYLKDPRSDRSFARLADRLLEDLDEPASSVESYIRNLQVLGLIEYEYGISGLDADWDLKVKEWLGAIEARSPLITRLIEELTFMREVADRLADCPSSGRNPLMKEAHNRFALIFNDLIQEIMEERQEANAAANRFPLEAGQLYYEDTLKSPGIFCPEGELQVFVDKLNTLLDKSCYFDRQNDEKRRMTIYFDMKYGRNHTIDFLQFYEDYYRDYKKQLDHEEPGNAPVPGEENAYRLRCDKILGEISAEREIWQERYLEELGHLDINREQIDITAELIDRVNSQLSVRAVPKEHISSSAFIQFYNGHSGGESRLMGVVNGFLPGNGKLFSRFLHLLDDQLTADLREWNKLEEENNTLCIENTDACYNNSNLHPPLFDLEISAPATHNILPPDRQVLVSDLAVHIADGDNFVSLVHKATRKKCQVYDLGFLGLDSRSKMFRLLNDFSCVDNFNAAAVVAPIIKKLNELGKDKRKGWTMYPRIVYEGNVILKRRSWSVWANYLPVRSSGEKDADYYWKVNQWRLELKMPDEIFLFVNPDRLNTHRGEGGAYTRDDYKPQYISFTNPLLVNLWEKVIRKAQAFIKIEEMLPGSADLMEMNGRRFVSESSVQWHKQVYEKTAI